MDTENESMMKVWDRVTSGGTATEDIIALEYASLQRLCRLGQRGLSGLIGEKRRRLRAMQTVYFIKTGDTAQIPHSPRQEGFLKALRRCYLDEKRLGELYASQCRGDGFYERLSRSAKCCEKALLRHIFRCLNSAQMS